MAPINSRRWVFTLNNYTDDERNHIDSMGTNEMVTYLIYGREVGEGGTPHLQGFVILRRAQRLSWLRRRLCARAHFEVARGTSQQASDYCKKDGDFVEFGTPPTQGGRTDLEDFIAWGDAFIAENGRGPTSPEIARGRPAEYVRYPRAVSLFAARAPPPQIRDGQLNEWQQQLDADLGEEPDDRTVRFFVDVDGGKGKTWFQQWYLTQHPDTCQILSIGKRDDLAFIIDVSKRVFLFNVPRDGMQFLQYTILEQLKDRIVHSFKYRSCVKVFSANVHVVVFCNEAPDMTKMSGDRFNIINL